MTPMMLKFLLDQTVDLLHGADRIANDLPDFSG